MPTVTSIQSNKAEPLCARLIGNHGERAIPKNFDFRHESEEKLFRRLYMGSDGTLLFIRQLVVNTYELG
jgi:hypothetical protein